MSTKIHALILGINDYPNPKHVLRGAVPDAKKINKFLTDSFTEEDLSIKMLLNEEATYQNVIDSFRDHLGKAQEGEVCWFHYSGHGARQSSAEEFHPYTSGNMDETLVLFDSRPTGRDLADKELVLLIDELEKLGVHILVTLDCCHSGSGTRSVADVAPDYIERLTEDRDDKRTLDSYLDGYYVSEGIKFPNPKHILLAACNRFQTAKETYTSSGVFTDNLIKTLSKTGIEISYSDLFVRLRQGVISNNIPDQDPQLELIGGTSGYAQFLNGSKYGSEKKIPVYKSGGEWLFGAGAIQGLQRAQEEETKLQIFKGEEKEPLTSAAIQSVSFQKCVINPDDMLDEDESYWALPETLPYPVEKVMVEGSWDGIEEYSKLFDRHSNIAQAKEGESSIAAYAFKLVNNLIELWDLDKNELIQKAHPGDADGAFTMFNILSQVVMWKRIFELQNPTTRLSTNDIITSMTISDESGNPIIHEPGRVTLNDVGNYPYSIEVHNRLKQPIHYCLLYMGEDYSITLLKNEPIESSQQPTLFWGGSEDDYFIYEDDQQEAMDTFMLIVSTERTDDFELISDGIEIGATIRSTASRGVAGINKYKPLKGEWFTQRFIVQLEK